MKCKYCEFRTKSGFNPILQQFAVMNRHVHIAHPDKCSCPQCQYDRELVASGL